MNWISLEYLIGSEFVTSNDAVTLTGQKGCFSVLGKSEGLEEQQWWH